MSKRLYLVVLRNRQTGVETRGTAWAHAYDDAIRTVKRDTQCSDKMWVVMVRKGDHMRVACRAWDYVRAEYLSRNTTHQPF